MLVAELKRKVQDEMLQEAAQELFKNKDLFKQMTRLEPLIDDEDEDDDNDA